MTGSAWADVEAAATEVVRLARERRCSLGTGESLTGGLLAGALTSVSGASQVVLGGVVAYDARIKRELLGVPAEVLQRHGAVSEATARAMAAGVCRVLGCEWGVATTGVAGPEPSEGHPIGRVHVAVHHAGAEPREEDARHQVFSLHGSREQIRTQSVQRALMLLMTSWDTR